MRRTTSLPRGLTVSEVRTDPPQFRADAAGADGASYSLSVVPDAARILAGTSTACLPDDDSAAASPPDAAAIAKEGQMVAFLDAMASVAAPGVTVGHTPWHCTVGHAVQHSIEPDDPAAAAAIFTAIGEYWATQGTVARDGTPDGIRSVCCSATASTTRRS